MGWSFRPWYMESIEFAKNNMFPLKYERILSDGLDEDNCNGLIDELPLGILSFDTRGNVTAVNRFLLEFMGSPSAASTKQINMLNFPPLVASGISASIREAISTGKITEIETYYHSKWGKEAFVRFKTIPRTDKEGHVIGCHAVIEDATIIKQTRRELEQKKRQENIYSHISSNFINTSFKDIDTKIDQTLEEIAKFTGAERASIFLATDDPDLVIKTHEWHAEGIRSQIGVNQKFQMQKQLNKFNELESIYVPDTQQLTDEDITVKETLIELGIQSVLLVPISYKGKFSGFIGLDCQTQKKEWDESTLYLLKLIGEMIINVLERKNTESLLVKKEEDYEHVVNAIDTIIWKADVDENEKLINTYISPAVDKMLGLPRGTIGNDWDKYFSCIHLEDIQKVLDALKLSLHNPENNVNLDYRLVKDNGDIVWVNSSTIAHLQQDGTVKIFGTVINITWRKHAEAELIRSEKKYRSLVEQSADAIFINRLDGRILDVNNKACQMLGYTKEQFQNMSVVDLQIPEEREPGNKVLDIFKVTKSIHGETKYLTANGNVINVEINAALLEGYHDVAQAVVRDITERKQAEEKLSRKEKKYRSLFEHSNDAIIIHDLEGNIIDVNTRTCDMLGYSIEEFKKITFIDLLPSDQLGIILETQKKIKHEGTFRMEIELIKADGHKMVADVSGSVVDVRPCTIQSIIRDISDRKQLEESLLHAKVIAEAASHTKSEFLANMSHELRTPLNAIIGFSDAMLEGYFGELSTKHNHYIQNISNSGKHLLNLINEILDISKVETGKMELFLTLIKLEGLIAEMVATMQPLTTKKKITVNIWNDNDTNIILMADEAKVKQIIYNLLGNAIKFTPNGGEINIRTNLVGSMVRISVIDNGIGISSDDQKKLFTPFTQLDNSVSKQYEGTGLGLALVKELVELHGGRVWVESEPGKGSNFTFELPAGDRA